MAKTNFTKVEEALTEGLRKIELEKLNQEALRKQGNASAPDEKQEARRQRVHGLKIILKWLFSQDKDFYTKLSLDRTAIKELLEKPDFADSEWEQVEEIFNKAEAHKGELEKAKGVNNDSDLIEKQRKRHKTRRFNINDKWLPLK